MLAIASLFILFSPLGMVVHRVVPSLSRLVFGGIGAAVAFPFFLVLEAGARHGSLVVATARSVGSRVLLLGLLLVGVWLGVVPGIVQLALPILAFVFLFTEIFGAALYGKVRSSSLVALVESIWLAGLACVSLPIS